MIDLLSVRGFLFIEAVACAVMFGGLVGYHWARLTVAWRVLAIGVGGLLIYLLTGQVKAYSLQVPSDAITGLGIVAYAIIISAMLVIRHKERSTHGGN